MDFNSWCNISGMKMSSSTKFLTLTLIISIVWTTGTLAKDDQKSKSLTSLSEATAEKYQQNKFTTIRDIYIDNDDEFEGSGRKGEVHEALEDENDDVDGSGSGYGGDDEDDVPTLPKNKINPKPDLTNGYHSVGLDKGKNIENPNKGSDPYDIAPTHHVPPEKPTDNSGSDNVYIMNTANEDRTTSFFAQPGILAAVIGGAVVGLLFAILVVMFIVYRMRKKDEGSYALDEPQKRSPQANSYTKNHNNREFYA